MNRRLTLWGKLIFINVAILILVLLNISTTISVSASATDAINEKKAGLADAPSNLGLDPNMFTAPDLSGYTNVKLGNRAELEDENGNSAEMKRGLPMKAIRMTQYKGEIGAIWSNLDNNYIDITKRQTMSMWLYFGPSKHADGSEFGDGMAFVVHKSRDKTDAIAHKGSTIGSGQSLGVWGLDNDKTVSKPDVIAATAIQNSWALEFDTYINKAKPGGASGFDDDRSGEHIAFGHPSESANYQDHYLSGGIFDTDKGNYFTMAHSDFQNVSLHDGKWHHLTIVWDPMLFQIHYNFNDKDPVTGAKQIGVTGVDNHIQSSEFGGPDNIADKKLYWGFTASTGDNYEPNLVAFESIPSQVEGETSADIKDLSQNKTVDDDDNAVNSNDQLAFNYNLKYNTGNDDWKGIVTNLNLPTNVTYTPDADNVIGKVTYADGTTEPIKNSDFTIDERTNKTVLRHTLGKSLTKDTLKTATITIYGVANNVDSDTTVPATRSRIDSATLIKDVDMDSFVIKKSKPINLTLDQNNISVSPNKDANITGTVNYVDNSTVDNSDITVYQKLNGKDLPSFKMNDALNNNSASGKLNFNVSAADLTEDSNTLEVYVKDGNGNRSATQTVTIAKKGGLTLKVEDYSFGSINQFSQSMLIPRKGLWNITVTDMREDGTTSPWTLSAQNSGLYNDKNTRFNGNMIYRSANGLEQNISGNSFLPIASGLKTQSGEQETNIGKLWNDSEGLMLRSDGMSSEGAYSGKVNWTLSDTV